MLLPKQIWKDIEGFENYQVNQIGQVRSLNYLHTGKIKRLSCKPRKDGYVPVVLCKDGKKYPKLVHRLVAEAFIPNPNNLPYVNHKIDDFEHRSDNRIENLEWCTQEYNNTYGTKCERHSKALKGRKATKETKQKMREAQSKPLLMLNIDNRPIACFSSQIEAYCYFSKSKTHGGISNCLTGKAKTAFGYQWKAINIIEL